MSIQQQDRWRRSRMLRVSNSVRLCQRPERAKAVHARPPDRFKEHFMSEGVIRCSKCGGTVAGETCTACGATGQAIKCQHCGSVCPLDARWCPSCGRRLGSASAKAAENGGEIKPF